MRKAFEVKLNKSASFKINFAYPDFKKEGLAALFPILDWITWIACLLFFWNFFGTRDFGFSTIKEQLVLPQLYTFVVVLFAVQLMRFIIGGIGHYPKTAFDVPALAFVAAVVISILLSGTQSNSVFGEEGLKVFSGVSNFALLLLYYLLVVETVTSNSISLKSILFFITLPFLFSSLNIGSYFLQGVELSQNTNYILFLFPLFFLVLLSSKNIILKSFSVVITAVALLNINFDLFYISLSLFVSMFISTMIFLGLGSDYVFAVVSSFWKDLMSLFKKKRISFKDFVKRNARILLFVPVYLFLFVGSIIKAVESYIPLYSQNFENSFSKLKTTLSGTRELLFGVGLSGPTGTFFFNNAASYGLLGVLGLILLIFLFVYYSVRAFRALKGNFEQIGVLAGSFIGVLMIFIFGIFTELSASLYILFWIFLGLNGIVVTKALYRQKLRLDSVAPVKGGKYKRILSELRYIGLVVTFAGAVFLIYLLGKS